VTLTIFLYAHLLFLQPWGELEVCSFHLRGPSTQQSGWHNLVLNKHLLGTRDPFALKQNKRGREQELKSKRLAVICSHALILAAPHFKISLQMLLNHQDGLGSGSQGHSTLASSH
jgi:hypothetical protein